MKEFTVGDSAIVSSTVSFYTEMITSNGKKKAFRRAHFQKTESFVAKITGFKYCFLGELDFGGSYQGEWGEYEYQRPYLIKSESVGVWLVRKGLMNKEIMVPEFGIEKYNDDFRLPVKHTDQQWVKDMDYRNTMRNEMKDWPRDSKGRWRKRGVPVQLSLFAS